MWIEGAGKGQEMTKRRAMGREVERMGLRK